MTNLELIKLKELLLKLKEHDPESTYISSIWHIEETVKLIDGYINGDSSKNIDTIST